MVDAASVTAALHAALPGSKADVLDVSGGCGSAFEVALVWHGFEGKARLARHRAVTGALADLMPDIHALSIKCATPGEDQAAQAGAGDAKPRA